MPNHLQLQKLTSSHFCRPTEFTNSCSLPTPPKMTIVQAPPRSFQVGDVFISAVGFGTFQGEDGNSKVKEAVLTALKNGYRHIDTAAAYGNEKEVGEAIKESGIPRADIFVTTKL